MSRPASLREWVWLAGCALWSAVWLTAAAGGLADQMVRAAGMLLAGAVTAFVLAGTRRTLQLAVSAVATAAAGLVAWCLILRVQWQQIEHATASHLSEGFLAQARAAGDLPGNFGAQAREVFRQLSGQSEALAQLLPGTLILAALAGVAVAWHGYHRIAASPFGASPRSFAQFSFSDHTVWAVIVGLALTLAQVPAPFDVVGLNLLLVALTLYAARGAAVVRAVAPKVPGPVMVGIVIASLFLLAFVLGGLMLLGLADNWLHFRRRLATPPTGGLNR